MTQTSKPRAVTTLEELRTLDEAQILRGYCAGLTAEADWSERDKGYWHGYLNGLCDGGHAQPSAEQRALARAFAASGGRS